MDATKNVTAMISATNGMIVPPPSAQRNHANDTRHKSRRSTKTASAQSQGVTISQKSPARWFEADGIDPGAPNARGDHDGYAGRVQAGVAEPGVHRLARSVRLVAALLDLWRVAREDIAPDVLPRVGRRAVRVGDRDPTVRRQADRITEPRQVEANPGRDDHSRDKDADARSCARLPVVSVRFTNSTKAVTTSRSSEPSLRVSAARPPTSRFRPL
jgi:hypothetical protein